MSDSTQRIVETAHTVADHASFLGWVTGIMTLGLSSFVGFFKRRFKKIDDRLDALDGKTAILDKTVSTHAAQIDETRKNCAEHHRLIEKRDTEFDAMVVRLHSRIDETNSLIRGHGEGIAANTATLGLILEEIREVRHGK